MSLLQFARGVVASLRGGGDVAGLGPSASIAAPPIGTAVTLLPPTIIGGKYQLEGKWGSGSYADVYRARNVTTGELVAIKWAHPGMESEVAAEALVLLKMRHPNIVRAYEVVDGKLVMEYIDGDTLLQKLFMDNSPLPPDQALSIVMSVAYGLQYAYKKHGVIHGDIKPANVMLTRDGRVKIIDWGIGSEKENRLGGMVTGTPEYMSPEQALGKPLDFRADIYSLGLLLYYLLTKRHPFGHDFARLKQENPGDEYVDAITRFRQTADVPLIEDEGIPEPLRTLVNKMTALNPLFRHDSYGELIEHMRSVAAIIAAKNEMLAQGTDPTSPEDWALDVDLGDLVDLEERRTGVRSRRPRPLAADPPPQYQVA